MKARAEIRLGDGSVLKTTQDAHSFANWLGGSQPAHIGLVELVDRGGSVHAGFVRAGSVMAVRELRS